MPAFDPDNLRLTDFMDLPTLQEIQDSFAAVANVKATITDAEGNLLTQPTASRGFARRQEGIAGTLGDLAREPHRQGDQFVAPIVVNNQQLGTIRMSSNGSGVPPIDADRLRTVAEKVGLDPAQVQELLGQVCQNDGSRPAAIQFLYLLANAIARLCFQEFQLRQRISELTAIYDVTTMLSEARDLGSVLQRTVEVVCEVMDTRAASIRLIDPENDEMVIRAVHNLSPEYLAKGPVRLSGSEIEREALDVGHAYVRNMATDPRVQYSQESAREGIVSMLSAGMRYKGQPIGVLRVYTDREQLFSQLQIDLLKAIAAQAAAAIENARLLHESIEAEALERQVQTAAEVQRRMLPPRPPAVPGVDLASIYVPCFTLGGDFYDFIPLPDDNIGLVMADVSGKGVPASLIMASVRAALRAQVDNVYYLYEVLRRVNVMLCRDTLPSEFVTLFYGVLDARNNRFTYCNAGHHPGMLLRNGQITELGGDNLVLGIDPDEQFHQSVIDLSHGDILLLYTDGLAEAMNFNQEPYGRERIAAVFKEAAGCPGCTADQLAHHILWDMRKFAGITKPADDVTLIVTRVAS